MFIYSNSIYSEYCWYQSLGDESELDVTMVGGDLSADGVAVGIRFAVQVLVAADVP